MVLKVFWGKVYSFTSSLIYAESASNYVVDVMTVTENRSKLHCNIFFQKKKSIAVQMFFWDWATWHFLSNSHTDKNNSQDFKHQYKKTLLFKLFLLKVSDRTSASKRASKRTRKIAYETKMNCLRIASHGRQVSLFYLFVSVAIAIYLNMYVCISYIGGICAFLLQQKTKFMCLSIEIEMRPLFALAIYTLLQNRMLQNGW